MSTNLLTSEGAPFTEQLSVRVHGHDFRAIEAARGTSLERADWLRWALRKVLHDARVWPYGVEHEVEVECPVCREPAVLLVWVTWDPGAPDVGILPRWSGDTMQIPPGAPDCGCILSEQDLLSACERAVEQWEQRLLSGEAHENAGAKP